VGHRRAHGKIAATAFGRAEAVGLALSAAAAGFLIFPNFAGDAVGVALAAGFFGWRVLAARRAGRHLQAGAGPGDRAAS
jgi:hypothetical protein